MNSFLKIVSLWYCLTVTLFRILLCYWFDLSFLSTFFTAYLFVFSFNRWYSIYFPVWIKSEYSLIWYYSKEVWEGIRSTPSSILIARFQILEVSLLFFILFNLIGLVFIWLMSFHESCLARCAEIFIFICLLGLVLLMNILNLICCLACYIQLTTFDLTFPFLLKII